MKAGEICGIRKSFGSAFSLGSVSLSIPRGAICVLTWPKGTGKTTLMKLLMGIGRPDGSTAELAGHDIRNEEVGSRASHAT
jgi:ABC-type multidrug transport system ATPase subunit